MWFKLYSSAIKLYYDPWSDILNLGLLIADSHEKLAALENSHPVTYISHEIQFRFSQQNQ